MDARFDKTHGRNPRHWTRGAPPGNLRHAALALRGRQNTLPDEASSVNIRHTSIRLISLFLVGTCLVAASLPGKSVDGDLQEYMKGLKNNLKVLAGALQSPYDDEASLSALNEMQIITIAAKRLQPSNLTDILPAKQAAHTKAYRASMARLLQELAAIEIDVLEQRHSAAFKRIKSELFEMRDSAHDKFQ